MDLPYKAEYAKSGRASCKKCKTNIAKDVLRLAVMVQSPMFDGKVPHWYHHQCFFQKQKPKSIDDIDNFDSLRYEDQKMLRSNFDQNNMTPGTAVDKVKQSGKASKRAIKKAVSSALKDFCVEYAKSNRAMCRGCEIKIAKGEVRISKKDFESEDAKRYGGKDLWHHIECFAKLRSELAYFESGEDLPGYNSLTKEDQANVAKALPKIKSEVKDEVDGPSEVKKIKQEDDVDADAMKEQTKRLSKFRDALRDFSKNELRELLEFNDHEDVTGDAERRERIAECMLFGVPAPCGVCEGGQLVFKTGLGYQCQGNLSGFTKCLHVEANPKKTKFVAPPELAEQYSFLKKTVFKVTDRIFKQREIPSTSNNMKDEPDFGPKINRAAPLRNLSFYVIGKLSKKKDDLKKEIVKLGGVLTSQLTGETTAVISNQDEVEKCNAKMELAKDLGIHVIPESFLEVGLEGSVAENILKLAISPWGDNVQKRIDSAVTKSGALKSGKSKSVFTKSVPSRITVKVKGGIAVEPESQLEDEAHVHVQGKDIYNAVLCRSSLEENQNSFYKMQVLVSDKKSKYWFFRSWGRIGTTIGNHKLEPCKTLMAAIQKFKVHFKEKTGNDFNDQPYEKMPGCYFPVEVDYGDSNNVHLSEVSKVPSKLHESVQELVRLLFDVERMKKVMLEYELDLEKMPLGKLSKKQIQKAFTVLGELCTPDGDVKPLLIKDVSNRFYTLIPHNFGVQQPPLLDSKERINEKIEMLQNLLEMETAYNLLSETGGVGTDDEHPIDKHYGKLNSEIDIVDRSSSEFSMIETYVKNTHAATHMNYKLNISELYRVKRHGEDKRFKPFKKLHNRKLLWHGSRLTNFAGILSQGLRIAPPEAPVTGYMFGKGIYFADMVSKSANYCMTSRTDNTGLLLICEVALGNMYERHRAEYITSLPQGMHSTKGIGMTSPNPAEAIVLEDGVEVPAGSSVKADSAHTSLLYNEYIVYDPAQVKSRYLLKVEFDYTC